MMTNDRQYRQGMVSPDNDGREKKVWMIVSVINGEGSNRDMLLRGLQEMFRDSEESIFCPMRRYERETPKGRVVRYVPLFARSIFIYASPKFVYREIRERKLYNYGMVMMRPRAVDALDYLIVPEKEMALFRWFCENSSDALVELSDPYMEFRDNLKVRVVRGQLKGLEGVIYKEGTNDHFVFRVGTIAIAAKNLKKTDLEVIGDKATAIKTYSIVNKIERVQERVRLHMALDCSMPFRYCSGKVLSELVLRTIHTSITLSHKQLVQYRWISREEGVQQVYGRQHKLTKKKYVLREVDETYPHNLELNRILSSLTETDRRDLKVIAEYVIMNHNTLLCTSALPDLSALFIEGDVPPFMTIRNPERQQMCVFSDHIELATKVRIKEENVSFLYQTNIYYSTDYDAHVCVCPDGDGGVVAVTSWSSCYDECMKYAGRDVQRLPLLSKLLTAGDEEGVRFMEAGGIKGTGIRISGVAFPDTETMSDEEVDAFVREVQPSVDKLVEVTKDLCQEIWHSTQFGLRRQMMRVWVKAVPYHMETIELGLDEEGTKKLLKAYRRSCAEEGKDMDVDSFGCYVLARLIDERYEHSINAHRLISKRDLEMIRLSSEF